MAKRFTDSEKWKDAWFMDLPSKYKLFWLYLLDECNHAGVWKVNFKVSIFYIGENLEYSEVKRILKSRITILNDEYWYINKFIKYQYNLEIEDLNYKNKVHLSVLKILNSYDEFKHLCSPLIGAKDKDKDKDIVKKEDITKRISDFKNSLRPFLDQYGKTLLTEFFEYWSEHGDNDMKFRKEKETSFSIDRRLKTWKRNQDKFKGGDGEEQKRTNIPIG